LSGEKVRSDGSHLFPDAANRITVAYISSEGENRSSFRDVFCSQYQMMDKV
jgi:hypothetical protein